MSSDRDKPLDPTKKDEPPPKDRSDPLSAFARRTATEKTEPLPETSDDSQPADSEKPETEYAPTDKSASQPDGESKPEQALIDIAGSAAAKADKTDHWRFEVDRLQNGFIRLLRYDQFIADSPPVPGLDHARRVVLNLPISMVSSNGLPAKAMLDPLDVLEEELQQLASSVKEPTRLVAVITATGQRSWLFQTAGAKPFDRKLNAWLKQRNQGNIQVQRSKGWADYDSRIRQFHQGVEKDPFAGFKK